MGPRSKDREIYLYAGRPFEGHTFPKRYRNAPEQPILSLPYVNHYYVTKRHQLIIILLCILRDTKWWFVKQQNAFREYFVKRFAKSFSQKP